MLSVANPLQYEAWNGWEGVHWAENAERYDAMLENFNDALFTAAAIGEQDRVLDIGCGAGQITRLAAGRASRGRVVGIDLSAPMLERARADALAEGLDNVTFEQGDAQVHPFQDGGFDRAISRGGVMFFEDLVAAFANIGRGLREGGRLAFISPQASDPEGGYAHATAALKPYMRAPSPAARGMMSMVNPDRIREVLADAGFDGVTVEPFEEMEVWGGDAEEAADFVCGIGPVRFNLKDLDQDTVHRLRDEVRSGFQPYETAQGVLIRGAVWVATATRP